MPVPIQLRDAHFIYHKAGNNEVHYEISDSDETGDPKYYGYLAANGAWIIMEVNEASGTYRYCAGASLYSAYWTARAAQSYGYYSLLASPS